MKDMFNDILTIIEESDGEKVVVEERLDSYYKANQDTIMTAQKEIKTKMDQAMGSLDPTNMADMGKMMEVMFTTLSDLMGKDNFQKMMVLQQKYPYLKDSFKNFVPNR